MMPPSDGPASPTVGGAPEPVAHPAAGAPGGHGPGARGGRGSRPQAVLEVLETRRVTPALQRVVLGGPGIAALSPNDATDKYVKLLLAPPGSDLTPPYDLEALRERSPELLPARRTYTVRWWDRDAGRLALDFVVHGHPTPEGIAATWALAAKPGDVIAASGAGGGYAPDPAADAHLLVGDHSALPAIASALEAMDPDAAGHALVQLDDEADIARLDHPGGVEVQWIIGPRELLLTRLEALDVPPGDVQVFAHGERGLIKAIRRHLVAERGLDKARISISAYWALGRVEDEFQAEKREPIGNIEADAPRLD